MYMAGKHVGMAAAAAVTLAALTACGGGGGSSSEGGSDDGWAGGETVKIGIIQPLSGAFAVLGNVVQNSMQVQVDKINAAGGVGGAKLELVVRDMQLDPAKAVQYSNELARDESVKLIVGPS